MKAGRNVWFCIACGKQFKHEKDECPFCLKSDFSIPDYPASRVKGARFQHYTGTTLWERAANKEMKIAATDDFYKKGN